jgi:hypothetical protein
MCGLLTIRDDEMNFRYLFAGILVFLVLSDTLFAANALIAYRSNTGSCPGSVMNCPKIKEWSSVGDGSWGTEVTLPTGSSTIRHLVLVNSPTSSKKNILITQGDDGGLDAYVCSSNCAVPSSWTVTINIGTVVTALSAPIPRRFDVEFETATGNAVVVYSVANALGTRDLAYKVLPSASSSFAGLPERYIDDTGHPGDISYSWVALDRKPTPGSVQMVLAAQDKTNQDVNAWVWSGTGWGSQVEISSRTHGGNTELLAVKYTNDGSQAMVLGEYDVFSGPILVNRVLNYRYWTGSWSGLGSIDPSPGTNDGPEWITLKANPLSQKDLQGVVVNDVLTLKTIFWSGAGWSFVAVDPLTDQQSYRSADFEWDYQSSDMPPPANTGKLVWDTDGIAGNTLSYRTCKSAGCTGATSTTADYGSTGHFISLYRNPTQSDGVDILGIRQSVWGASPHIRIGSFRWAWNNDGFVNYGDTAITSDASEGNLDWGTTVYSLAFQD